MARPQTENGYTPIANELMDVICSTPFNATQFKILLFVMRYTYGFSRKEHKFSLNFISRGTGITRRYVSSELKKLINFKVIEIVKKHTDTEARILKINKDYEAWGNVKVLQVNDCSTGEGLDNTTGEGLDNTTGEELFHQDKQNLKQNLKQYRAEFENLWKVYPNRKGKGKAEERFCKLRKNYSLEEMERTIERYANEVSGKEKRYIQHGSTFFNSSYIDYLDDNYTPPEPESKSEYPDLTYED